MEGKSDSMKAFARQFEETESLSNQQILLGMIASVIILIGSTWGVLSLLNYVQIYIVDPSNLVRYTMYMILASIVATVFAIIISLVMIRWPRIVSLPLRIHRFAKRRTGEYFLSPEPQDQSMSTVLRRSLYGSILVVGISLTVLGFDLMVANAEQIIPSGTFLMLASIIVLPITIMEFYFGPWLIKDSGLFHLDERDRSLSNVGDDLEDILEFFAGVDIILILLELTISVGPIAPWLPIFIILIPLGPLLSIVLNFTIIFMVFKKKATLSMIEYLSTRYEVPDTHSSPDYIRSRVLALVERDLLMNLQSDNLIEHEASTDVVVDESETPEPLETTPESITEDDS
ncbi:MAG: hypothetical protein KAR03_04480 [Candidatus Thorarchaeota archaeon]|nr:hypothetical protein [Candidatus Thorarchaeota archaeon]